MVDLATDGAGSASSGPSLADDEAKLADYARGLAEATDAELDGWIRRSVADRAPADVAPADLEQVTATAIAAARSHVLPRLRILLAADIAEQRTGPLDMLRSAVRFATAALDELGARPVERGEFEERTFPDDRFDLSPASFADVAPALHEPGLLWGAAKAHVHLRRRRDAANDAPPAPAAGAAPSVLPPTPTVVAFAPDLIDASKVKGAVAGVSMVRSAAALAAVTQADVVLVDLGRPGSLDAIATLAQVAEVGHIIAFGSHVDDAVLAEATTRGADEVLARSVFFVRLAKGKLLA